MTLKVYESGSGKWLKLNQDVGDIIFTSNEDNATSFDDIELNYARDCFWEFSIYKNTLHAIPTGSNCSPHDCRTVNTYLSDLKTRRLQEVEAGNIPD